MDIIKRQFLPEFFPIDVAIHWLTSPIMYEKSIKILLFSGCKGVSKRKRKEDKCCNFLRGRAF